MLRAELDRFDASLVVVGALNPAIVTPDWLWQKQLISESDKDECNQNLQAHTAQGVISYKSEWFAANIVHQKLSATTSKGSTPRIRDLVVGIMECLPETPVSAIGINFHADYKFNAAEYYLLGDELAPKDPWEKIFPKDKFTVGTYKLSVEIRDGVRPPSFPDSAPDHYQRIDLDPSPRAPGIAQFTINNHFNMPENSTGKALAKFVLEKWEGEEAKCRQTLDSLLHSLGPS